MRSESRSRLALRLALALIVVLGGSGLMLRGQSPQTVHTWADAGSIPDRRSYAATATLADGRTLLAGGYADDGSPLGTIVIFDPADNSFTPAGDMTAPRVGHTATLLEDGRVLIAGGMIGGVTTADLEVFNPIDGTSSMIGTMSVARSGHGAVRLDDLTVLIAGGTDGTQALSSGEIFDPVTGATTPTAPMTVARAGASATRLIDGRVLVAGGNDGTQDLASAEIYYPGNQSFDPVPTALAVPRSGHAAVLLPFNNSVLLAGGSSNGVPQNAADLFLPAVFPDPYSYGTGSFAATAPLLTARAGAAAGPAAEGFAFAAGGVTSNGGANVSAANTETYRFATIRTDLDDYIPGQRAVITGTGWEANEAVTLLFQEDPPVHTDYVLTVQADAEGRVYWDQWAPEQHDLGVRFYLTASGSRSMAQTTFTDGVVSRISHSTAVAAGAATTLTIAAPANLQPNDLLIAQIVANGNTGITGPAGWTEIDEEPRGNDITQAIYWRRVGTTPGVDGATYQWTLSSSQQATGGITVYRGVSPTANPIHREQVAESTGMAATSITALSAAISAGNTNAKVLYFYAIGTSVSSITIGGGTAPAVTAVYNTAFNSGAGGPSAAAAEYTKANPGDTPSGTSGTKTGSTSTATHWVAHTIVLNTDNTAPGLTVSLVTPSTTAGMSSVEWRSTENVSYSLRIGSTTCADGTEIAAGDYTFNAVAPSTVTMIPAAALADGANTLRLCVTDPGENQTATTFTVTRDGAAPTGNIFWVDESFGSNASGGLSTVVIPRPAGAQPGDVLLAQIVARGGSARTFASSGWTQVIRNNNAIAQSILVHVVDPADPASYTFTLGGGGEFAAGGITAYRGVDTASPTVTSAPNTGSGTTLTAPSITPAVANTRVVYFWSQDQGGNQFTISGAGPAGTPVFNDFRNADSSGPRGAAAHFTHTPAGIATGTKAVTTSNSNNWVAHTVALRPDTTAPVVTITLVDPNPTSDGSTVTWNATQSGSYSVRVGGTSCTTGTEIASGDYTAPAPVSTPIAGSDLADGPNTVRVCVTDAANNVGFDEEILIKSSQPVAADAVAATDEDTPSSPITLSATDHGTCELAFSIVTPPANGTLSAISDLACAPGSPNTDTATVVYTPAPDFHGTDTFTYKANDGTSDSNTATVTITINPVNDVPVANADAATVTEDSASNAIDVLANDTDADNLTPPLSAGLTVTAVTDPAHGTAAFTGGGVTYTPDANFFGTDSFTYTGCDAGQDGTPGNGDDACATATVTVTVSSVDDAPVAGDDAATVDEDTGPHAIAVLANDTDADNLPPAAANAGLIVTSAGPGSAGGTITTDGTTVSYTPAPNFYGTETFDYTVSDGASSDSGTVTVTVTNVPDAPVANGDSAAVAEDSTANPIDVLANDTDADNLAAPFNAGLTVTAVTDPANGSAAFTAGGVTYTPDPNFYGADSFTYTIQDPQGNTAVGTVTVTVTNVNDAPVANADAATVAEDTTSNPVDVLANDTDADNLTPPLSAGLTVTAVTDPANGTSAFTPTGVTYTPDANFFGTDTFTYTVCDAGQDGSPGNGDDACATATITMTVTNVADAPVANADSATVAEDSADNAIDVLANDTDADNLTPPLNAGLTVTGVSNPAHGSAAFTASGVTYTPDANFFGTDGFTYTVQDPEGNTAVGTVSVTVTNVPDPPVANADAATVDEDSVDNAVDVLANDTDADNLTPPLNAGLTVIAVSDPANGTAAFTAGGVTYTPDANFFGADSFTYTVQDPEGNTATGTVTVTVTAVNDPPVANADATTVVEDSASNPIDVLANDTDADNLTPPLNAGLTVTAVSDPVNGSAAFSAGGVTYTPDANFFGTDSFTYTVCDAGQDGAPGNSDDACATAAVTVTVTNVPDPPIANADSATVTEDSAANPIDVLANDTDADNLTPPLNAGLTVTAVTDPPNGSAAFTAAGVTYTPDADFFGTDSFTYTVEDPEGNAATGTVTVTVTNVNDAPVANADAATVAEDSTNNAIDVLANDTDADNLTPPLNAGLTITAVTDPANGTAAFTPAAVTYTPDPNFFGSDSFTYTVCDGGQDGTPGNGDDACATTTVTVTVTNVNDAPVANADSATVAEDTTSNAIDVLANDTDADNLAAPFNAGLRITAVTDPAHGTATFTPTGVAYTPDPDFFGSDSFTYTVCDAGQDGTPGNGDDTCATGTVDVTVTNVNDAPVAGNDAYATSEDTPLTVAAPGVLGNDVDVDGDPLTAALVGGPAHGSVTLNPDGSFTYTPGADYNGPDSFTYRANDSTVDSNVATVSISVSAVNDAPANVMVGVLAASINEGDIATLNGTFTDPDTSDVHTVTVVWGDGSPSSIVTLTAGARAFTITHQYKDDNPTATPSDLNAIMVTVADNGAPPLSAGGATAVTVANLAPEISNVSGPIAPLSIGTAVTITATFTDAGTEDTHKTPPGGSCTVNWDDGTPPSNGTVTESNGSGTCTASRTYVVPGVYSIVVTITDDDGGSAARKLETEYVVVFDPNGGFVTGGGWIDSPPGASPAFPTATGKANFGFVSKYKKGSNVPEGQTEFQFKAGDLNFHSSAYDAGSLVVSGHKAQYRGSGTVNGVPGYRFVLTAYDGQRPGGGGVDRFRIKITLGGTVVYDNRLGGSDDVDAADPMIISGGSIVIHDGKK